MTTNERLKRQKVKLYYRQKKLCYYCGLRMIHPAEAPAGGVQHPRLCTLEHLDDRFDPGRGKKKGYRRVAACFQCNQQRAQLRQAVMSREELRAYQKRVERERGREQTS